MSDSRINAFYAELPRMTVPPALELTRRWERGERPQLGPFVTSVGPLTASELAAVLHVDQHHRWQLGERIKAEAYFQQFPVVCVDDEAAIDVVFHEYLLRERLGERPDSGEYAARFPAYSQALAAQIAFHRLLGENQSPLSGSTALDSTKASPDDGEPARGHPAQLGLAPRGGVSSRRELQSLLRSRLRLLATLSFVAFLLYLPVLWTLFTPSWGTVIYVVAVSYAALTAVLLSSRLEFSLRSLRWIELGLFLSLLAYFGYQQMQFFRLGFFSALSLDHWIGPAIAARSMSWPWAVTIITYGILIPNTARRGVVAIGMMSAAFLAITLGLALTATAVPTGAAFNYLLCSATDMAFAASIAIFGAFRIAKLQQAASTLKSLGPYRLIRRLGSGGMGEVYLAEHALLRRPCALKLIRPGQAGDGHLLNRFEREVQAMAALTHPNTVRVYDYGVAVDGTFYYAMEYLPGLSLQELVARHGPLPAGRAVHLLRQVCQALREAHSLGLVHRDIKPANIIAAQAGGQHDVAKLLDFGLVRAPTLGNDEVGLTGIGTIAGTPAFMSPEQAAGALSVDARSDIYSLGAVAYYLLTGQPPFLRSTSVETMAAHLSEAPQPPRQRRADLPVDLEDVILRCLNKDPSRRFEDIGQVESSLANCACCSDWTPGRSAEWWQGVGGRDQ